LVIGENRLLQQYRHEPAVHRRPLYDRFQGDIVAKVAAAPLWNSNLKQSNRNVRTVESMLRLRVKT
jgi:hypothetical protein